jgi:hypothetical protein
MKPLGLRERLLFFYALMALTPVTLSGALLYFYLNSQVAQSAERFQRGVQKDLQRSQQAVRESAAATLRNSQQQMQQKITQHMDASREQMLQQQKRLLKETVGALQKTTESALHQTERSTLQNLKPHAHAGRSAGAIRSGAVAGVVAGNDGACDPRRAAASHRQPFDSTQRTGLASSGEPPAQLHGAIEPDCPAARDSAGERAREPAGFCSRFKTVSLLTTTWRC